MNVAAPRRLMSSTACSAPRRNAPSASARGVEKIERLPGLGGIAAGVVRVHQHGGVPYPGKKVEQLESDQLALSPEFDGVVLQVGTDAPNQGGTLQELGHIAIHHDVDHLQLGQPILVVGEAATEPLQRQQVLIGLGEKRGRASQLELMIADEDRHRLAALADDDDGASGLDGDPLGGAVPGSGLTGGDRWIRDEMNVGPIDHLRRLIGDHRAVHLGEFGEAGRAEVGPVEMKPSGADRLDIAPVTEHDQRAGLLAKDQLDGVAQPGTRGKRSPDVESVILLGHGRARLVRKL